MAKWTAEKARIEAQYSESRRYVRADGAEIRTRISSDCSENPTWLVSCTLHVGGELVATERATWVQNKREARVRRTELVARLKERAAKAA
jgi:hypothetical protein